MMAEKHLLCLLVTDEEEEIIDGIFTFHGWQLTRAGQEHHNNSCCSTQTGWTGSRGGSRCPLAPSHCCPFAWQWRVSPLFLCTMCSDKAGGLLEMQSQAKPTGGCVINFTRVFGLSCTLQSWWSVPTTPAWSPQTGSQNEKIQMAEQEGLDARLCHWSVSKGQYVGTYGVIVMLNTETSIGIQLCQNNFVNEHYVYSTNVLGLHRQDFMTAFHLQNFWQPV